MPLSCRAEAWPLLHYLVGLQNRRRDVVVGVYLIEKGFQLGRVRLADMPEQEGSIGPAGHRQPGGEDDAAEATAIAGSWAGLGHQRASGGLWTCPLILGFFQKLWMLLPNLF
jgi:hypothetical protein